MNKVCFQKKKIYTLFGFDILKVNEFYTEKSQDDILDDIPPINITQGYANKEFKIDR